MLPRRSHTWGAGGFGEYDPGDTVARPIRVVLFDCVVAVGHSVLVTVPARALVENGVAVITVPDIRWQRPDIKSVSLLPNILAKQQAVRKGVYESWQVDANGMVTEGTSTNAWIVVGDRLVTHAPDHAILNGVTRLALLEMAAAEGLILEERAFGADEARRADEAFLTSTTAFVMPIVKIDDSVIGDGKPGPRTRALLARYAAHLRSGA